MKKCLYLIVFIVLVSLTACNLPRSTAATPTTDPAQAALTFVAQTVEAELSQAILTQPATVTPEAQAATALPTQLVIVETPAPIPVSSPTNTQIPCNQAVFVQDVSIPDGKAFAPGETFTKTWRLKNNGSCAWNSSYALVFDQGDKLSGPDTQPLSGNVAPGATVDLSVNLKAPANPGSYRGYWRLRDGSGVLFGLTTGSFWVDIKVVASATLTPTATYPSLPPPVAAVDLYPVSGENGTIYEPAAGQGIPNTILAGDTGSNHLARGYMSFDISSLAGMVITGAQLDLSSCSTMGNPFSLGGIWVGEVQYSTPLKQSDYELGGTGIQLLSAFPSSPIDVKARVQARVGGGGSRFQIRLHSAGPSNGNSAADYIMCSAPKLFVSYTAP